MPRQNRKFGDWGEKTAEDYLVAQGFSVLERNFQRQCGELDLICQKGDVLHFIEVKTRTKKSTEKFGLPQEAVTVRKRQRLILTAETYITEKDLGGNINWQMDVLSIVCSPEEHTASICFIENAFGEDQPF